MTTNAGTIAVAAESYPMTGGDGTYSYNKNSSFQRNLANAVQRKIEEAIDEKLDIGSLFSTSKTFCIADFGCSVGPNTFIAMQNIVEAVAKKHRTLFPASQSPEFQVFFNDHVSNDFNILFTTLPSDRNYFAAGVPGSFHGRLLPENSLHFAYSNAAVQWLSKVPEEVLDQNSPAWNKGRIQYKNAPNEVVNAFASEFARGMEIFLAARAKELVTGGMMVLHIPARPTGVPHSQSTTGVMSDFLESSFIDMVNEGLISEAQVNSFNFPVFIPSPEELQQILDRNGCFNIEKMEMIGRTLPSPSERTDTEIANFGQKLMMHIRASNEGIISRHFGTEILDDLFDRFRQKVVQSPHRMASAAKQGSSVFIVLTKRKDSAAAASFLAVK